jgi:hypothetical protein
VERLLNSPSQLLLNVTLNERERETKRDPVPEDVIFTSLKSLFLTVKLPVDVFNGVSALYAVPETSGDGRLPVDVKLIKTPVEGVIITIGVDVYPLPDVIALTRVTFPDVIVIPAFDAVPFGDPVAANVNVSAAGFAI